MKAKDVLQELVDACLNVPEAAAELDAGCEGEGPLAQAMVYLKMAKNTEEATNQIYGEGMSDGRP